MFGWKIVREKDIIEIDETVTSLSHHIWDNAKFVNEVGTTESDGNNPVIIKNWRTFNELMKKFYDLRRNLR